MCFIILLLSAGSNLLSFSENEMKKCFNSYLPVLISYSIVYLSKKPIAIILFFSGMDCVSQDDVLPYTPLEETALEHDLFDRIFELKLKNGDFF